MNDSRMLGGDGAEGRRPAILIVSRFCAAGRQPFEALVTTLRSAGRAAELVEIPETAALPEAVQVLDARIQELGFEVVLAGHADGAAIVLAHRTNRHNDKVRGTVLINPALGPLTSRARREVKIARAARGHGIGRLVRPIAKRLLAEGSDPDAIIKAAAETEASYRLLRHWGALRAVPGPLLVTVDPRLANLADLFPELEPFLSPRAVVPITFDHMASTESQLERLGGALHVFATWVARQI